MKKQYIIPDIKVYNVDVLLMLNTSDTEGDGNQFVKKYHDDFEDDYWDYVSHEDNNNNVIIMEKVTSN